MLLVLILLVSLATAGNPMARAVQRLSKKHAPLVPTVLKHAAPKKVAAKTHVAPAPVVKTATLRSQLMRLPAQMMKHKTHYSSAASKKKGAARK